MKAGPSSTTATAGQASRSGPASSEPTVELVSPNSPVTTLRTPDLRDGHVRRLAFGLYGKRGTLNSPPMAVSVALVPRATAAMTVHLEPGLNLLALPMEPWTDRWAAASEDLQQVLRSPAVVRLAYSVERPRGAFVVAATGLTGFRLEPDEGYLLVNNGPGRDVQCSARAWSKAAGRRVELAAGLNLVAVPRGISRSVLASELLERSGGAFAARPSPDLRMDWQVKLREGAGAGFTLAPGQACFMWVTGPVAFELP